MGGVVRSCQELSGVIKRKIDVVESELSKRKLTVEPAT